MQLFYNPSLKDSLEEFYFSAEESRHIAKVLRKREGDLLHITNGEGFLFNAEILIADQKKCLAKIISTERAETKKYKLHIAVAPTKMNDRFEWFLEKATEIGIDQITPIICERSERKTIRESRFERVIQSAMKQSLQTYLPVLNPITDFKSFMAKKHNSKKFIAHCEDMVSRQDLKKVLPSASDATILIGPEGDFSSSEIIEAHKIGYKSVTLGNSRLRTETAAVVACSIASFIND